MKLTVNRYPVAVDVYIPPASEVQALDNIRPIPLRWPVGE